MAVSDSAVLQAPHSGRETLDQFRKYLVPGMLTMMLMAVYTFTDTYVVAQKLGALAVGAMGVCTPVLTITYAFGFLFGMGGAGRYAIAKGQGRTERANRIFSTAAAAAVMTGAAAAVILNIAAVPFAYFLGAKEENISLVMPYLRVLLVYIPGFMMDIVMMCFMKNEGHPNIAMIATCVGTGMNVALDFLFVFGFDWGMFGAAFATALCSGIGCSINIICAFAEKMNIRFRKSLADWKELPRILKNGVSVLVLESSSGIVTFVFIGEAQKLCGIEGASVYTIIMNWSLICVNLVMGIAQAAQPLLGYACGKGREQDVRDYRRYAEVFSLILGAAFLVIGYSAARPLVAVFVSDNAAVLDLTESAFRIYLPAFLFMAPGIVLGYYFQSLGLDRQALTVMLARGIVLPCLYVLILPGIFGQTGIWGAAPAAELTASILAVILLHRSPASFREPARNG